MKRWLAEVQPHIYALLGFVLFLLCTKYALEQYIGLTQLEMLAYVKDVIRAYGLPLAFCGAFLEGLLLVGMYFPGSFVIFVTIIVTETPQEALRAVGVVTVGLLLAYCVNYILGKYGWYRLLVRYGLTALLEDAQQKLEGHHLKAFLMSYWQPGLASLTATAAGVLQMSFARFFLFSILSLCVWNAFWGTLAYTFKDAVFTMVFSWQFLLAAAVIYTAVHVYEEKVRVVQKVEISQ